ncbi:hypothetical protein HDU92_004352 [Lobulomyces angularis]|nr:hypothetical protein HDU92_004352 [Lobulomyces angularis]
MKFSAFTFALLSTALTTVASAEYGAYDAYGAEPTQSPAQQKQESYGNQSPQQGYPVKGVSQVENNVETKCVTSTITIPASTTTLPPQTITVFETAVPQTMIRKCKPKQWKVKDEAELPPTKGVQEVEASEAGKYGQTEQTENTAETPAMEIIVGDGGLKFGPTEMKVKEGDKITFKFPGATHNIYQTTEEGGCEATEGGFKFPAEGLAKAGDTFEFTVPTSGGKKGLWFACKPHCEGGMKGSLLFA